MRGCLRAAVAAFGLAALLVAAAPGSGTVAAAGVRFATPVYIDQQLAGGEPEVLSDPLHGTLVYTSHEGTTHPYRSGLITSPWGDFSFVTNYCNQVNVWTSTDGGANWFRDRYLGSPWPSSPAINTGFSDPDLTADASGRIYDTGIDLANDALFSSADGGRTWDRGTPQRRDREGSPPRRLLHERGRRPRLRGDRDRRHDAHGSDHGSGVPDVEAALHPPRRGPEARRLGELLVEGLFVARGCDRRETAAPRAAPVRKQSGYGERLSVPESPYAARFTL